MTNRRLADLTEAECLKAYYLNRSQGEGCYMISGELGCSVQTANATINKGERILKAQASVA